MRRVEAIVRAVPRYYGGFDPLAGERSRPWFGFRPCTPDGLPYLGRLGAHPNLIVATGHAMIGISLGPITGRIVADLVAERSPEIDLTLLSPDRYL
jgi:D-amino-acid dehydrogenase